MSLLASEVKPDDSGFFSLNLFKWLKKNPEYSKIYKAPWNSFCGYNPDRPVLMIGFICRDGWFHGRALRSVCCGHRVDYQAYAYSPKGHHVEEWQDVTSQFIDDYKRIGVCAIHGDLAHRFEHVSKKEKRCLNCGKVYIKKSRRVTEHYWEEGKGE